MGDIGQPEWEEPKTVPAPWRYPEPIKEPSPKPEKTPEKVPA